MFNTGVRNTSTAYLLLTLTQDWTPGDGRTLFLVGDPMQSIYGFRNAEVGRFSTVRDGGLGAIELEPLELRRNFRSAKAIVHWCNDAFARVFPAADDVRIGAVRHLASVAARDDLAGESYVRRVVGNACSAAEATDVAARIAALRRERPEDSVAVLAGTRLHLRDVRRALQEQGVPFVGVKLEPLADVPVVRDLEALSRALADGHGAARLPGRGEHDRRRGHVLHPLARRPGHGPLARQDHFDRGRPRAQLRRSPLRRFPRQDAA